MELYIDKVALDKLNIDFLNENLVIGQMKLLDILQSYDELYFYTNQNFENEQFEEYKSVNLLFNKIIEKAILRSVESIESFTNESTFEQTIVIENSENHINRNLIESKGGLYFVYETYSEKIEELCFHYTKKIDLDGTFAGWQKILNKTLLKVNEIIINDNYLIDDFKYINESILPLLKSVKKQFSINRIVFITDYLNKSNYQKDSKLEILKTELNTSFINIFHNNFRGFSNHDRILYTNFFMIDCPIGFSQVNKTSNSVIYIETIFDKFTYNRRRRHLKELNFFIDQNS